MVDEMNANELDQQWVFYKSTCDAKGIEAGTKEEFIKRNSNAVFTSDCLLDVTPKPPCLSVKTPLFKAEDNITLSRRELMCMLEEVALRAYELGIKESA